MPAALSAARKAAARKAAAHTADDLSVGGVLEMAVHDLDESKGMLVVILGDGVDDLLAEGEGAAEALAHDGDVLVEPLVVDELAGLQLAVGDVGQGGGKAARACKCSEV